MASDVALEESGARYSSANERASDSYRRKATEYKDRAAAAVDVAKRLNYLQLADYWNDMARDAEVQDQIRSQPSPGAAGG